jgi:hypothetical protein
MRGLICEKVPVIKIDSGMFDQQRFSEVLVSQAIQETTSLLRLTITFYRHAPDEAISTSDLRFKLRSVLVGEPMALLADREWLDEVTKTIGQFGSERMPALWFDLSENDGCCVNDKVVHAWMRSL